MLETFMFLGNIQAVEEHCIPFKFRNVKVLTKKEVYSAGTLYECHQSGLIF